MDERMRILAVDDEPVVLRSIRNTLSKAGYVVIGTGNPNEMTHLIATEQPHLVRLDLILPGTNGFELMKHIRQTSRVPVIFLSGHDRNDDVVGPPFPDEARGRVVIGKKATHVSRIREHHSG